MAIEYSRWTRIAVMTAAAHVLLVVAPKSSPGF